MTAHFDRVVVSANESWLYLDFWLFVAYTYRTMFPDVRVTLAFLTDRLESDPFVEQLRTHGEVVLLRPLRDIPQAAQAKMARYFVAASSMDPGEVCLIDDIDWIPIDREWLVSKVSQRVAGTMLLVGQEVFGGGDAAQAPASMMTAEASLFRALFNPDGLAFEPWLRSLGGREGRHRDIYSRVYHEGTRCTTDAEALGAGAHLFSDEALIIRLREERPIPVTSVVRGYDVAKDTVDRSYWNLFDPAKLARGEYLGAHTGRPYLEHKDGNDQILDYIRRRYGGADIPAPLAKEPFIDRDVRFANDAAYLTFKWIRRHVPVGRSVLEIGRLAGAGDGTAFTSLLTRYYETRTITADISEVNIYPSHYIYAPGRDGKVYDPDIVRRGLEDYSTRRPHGALVVHDSRGVEEIVDILPPGPFFVADGETLAGRRLIDLLTRASSR